MAQFNRLSSETLLEIFSTLSTMKDATSFALSCKHTYTVFTCFRHRIEPKIQKRSVTAYGALRHLVEAKRSTPCALCFPTPTCYSGSAPREELSIATDIGRQAEIARQAFEHFEKYVTGRGWHRMYPLAKYRRFADVEFWSTRLSNKESFSNNFHLLHELVAYRHQRCEHQSCFFRVSVCDIEELLMMCALLCWLRTFLWNRKPADPDLECVRASLAELRKDQLHSRRFWNEMLQDVACTVSDKGMASGERWQKSPIHHIDAGPP